MLGPYGSGATTAIAPLALLLAPWAGMPLALRMLAHVAGSCPVFAQPHSHPFSVLPAQPVLGLGAAPPGCGTLYWLDSRPCMGNVTEFTSQPARRSLWLRFGEKAARWGAERDRTWLVVVRRSSRYFDTGAAF